MNSKRTLMLGLVVVVLTLAFVFRDRLLPGPDFSQYTPEAMFKQGQMSENGWGRDPDVQDAIEWYTRAAEQGHVAAERQLGSLYYSGRLVEKDLVKAFDWYRQAAENGDVESQNQLGWMYHHGEGVPVDRAEAEKWYQRARDQETGSEVDETAERNDRQPAQGR